MMGEDREAQVRRAAAALPIFPLSGALLLPRGQLPLNIFEPRYLNMIEDALAGERMIGMVQPVAPQRDPVSETAELFGVGCVGRHGRATRALPARKFKGQKIIDQSRDVLTSTVQLEFHPTEVAEPPQSSEMVAPGLATEAVYKLSEGERLAQPRALCTRPTCDRASGRRALDKHRWYFAGFGLQHQIRESPRLGRILEYVY